MKEDNINALPENLQTDNFITFDAHDPRVANAIPLKGFDNYITPFQFVRALLDVEKDLNNLLEPQDAINANHWFVLFGRYTCKAQKPNCVACPLSHLCQSSDKKI